MSSYKFLEFEARSHMIASLDAYIETGRPLGDFLTAVVQNDLSKAISHGDLDNLRNLPALVAYLYNKAPSVCWGDRELVLNWMRDGGLKGRNEKGAYEWPPRDSNGNSGHASNDSAIREREEKS